MNIEIRDFRKADFDALLGLIRELQTHESQYFDRMKSPEDIGPSYVEGLLKLCENCAGRILLAWKDETPLGYAVILSAVASSSILNEIPYEYAFILDAAVTAPWRRRGVDSRLIGACEAYAKERGAKWLPIAALAKTNRRCRPTGNTASNRIW